MKVPCCFQAQGGDEENKELEECKGSRNDPARDSLLWRDFRF